MREQAPGTIFLDGASRLSFQGFQTLLNFTKFPQLMCVQ